MDNNEELARLSIENRLLKKQLREMLELLTLVQGLKLGVRREPDAEVLKVTRQWENVYGDKTVYVVVVTNEVEQAKER
jgi:hypothetical protein